MNNAIRRQRERGFSFVELIGAMTFVVVLSAATLPVATSSLERSRLQNDARQVATACRYARMLAVSSNATHRVRVTADTVEVARRSGSNYITVSVHQFAGGVSASTNWSADPLFSPRGTVSSPGSAVLSNRRGAQRTVSVSVVGAVQEQ